MKDVDEIVRRMSLAEKIALMAGGILCFLRRYVTARFTCGCGQGC